MNCKNTKNKICRERNIDFSYIPPKIDVTFASYLVFCAFMKFTSLKIFNIIIDIPV